MASAKYLKVTLTLMALYAGIMGSLTLFFQDVAAFLFGYNITDPVATRYWGAVLLTMSIFYLFLSMDPVKHRLFLWIGVFDLGFASTLTVLNVATKHISVAQGIVAIVLNPIFMVILLYGLAKPPEGEVVLMAGHSQKPEIPEHELPAHLSGTHPLKGK